VPLDEQGRYTVLLGSASADGLPLDLFANGKARWLGVWPQLAGVAEPPRALLVGVPYALKAADTDTLGGLPASAFLQVPATVGQPVASSGVSPDSVSAAAPKTGCSVTSDGTAAANEIAYITDACNVEGSSTIVESGGKIGIGTSAPAATLEVKGTTSLIGALKMYAEGSASASAGAKSYPIIFGAATFDGAISTAVNQTFEWQAEPVGNDTASPAASMNLLYAAGSATPANTGFSIGSNGEINFAAGQTFPGTGTITSVTPGTGLTGGGSSGSVTLDVNEGVVAFQSDFTAGINTAETYAKNNFLPLTGGSLAGALSGTTASFANYSASGTYQIGGANVLNAPINTADTFVGLGAGYNTDTANASFNVFLGTNAGWSNSEGQYNTAVGMAALYATTASNNTAVGAYAMWNNVMGSGNTATGWRALNQNTGGNNNTGIGYSALYNNDSGSNNVAVGYMSGYNLASEETNDIDIGNPGVAGENNVTRIGASQSAAYISGIYGVNVSGAQVVVSSSGQLGVVSSSRRYKEDIRDMGDASGGLLRLRPVTFRYKQPYAEASNPIEYGLIAEEVAGIYPDMVVRSADGQIETVKYQELTPMLLNEVQRQQRQIQDLAERLAKVEAVLEGAAARHVTGATP